MDLGLDHVTQASESSPAKRFGITPRDPNPELVNIVKILTKLCLSNAAHVRALWSILLSCWLVSAQTTLVEKMTAATKKCSENFEALRGSDMSKREKEDRLGAPHIHAWNALLRTVKDHLTAKQSMSTEETTLSQNIQAYCDQFQQLGWRMIAREVKYCRLCKVFEKHQKRLEIHFKQGSPSFLLFWDKGLCDYLVQHVFKDQMTELPFQAPPGYLERSLQTWLDKQKDSAEMED